MKAIILAAGRGTRISKNIGNIPKCTVSVGDVPLIRRTVEMLRKNGVTDISAVLGYRHADVTRALEGLGVREFVNPFYRVTNSIASLWFAREAIADDDILVCNGDVFWTQEIFQKIADADRDMVMLADRRRADDGDYFFRTENGVLKGYGKELARSERDCEYVGIAKISRKASGAFREKLVDMVDAGVSDLWWENVLYEMSERTPIYVEDVGDAFWAEVDFIEDYNRILDYVARSR